MPWHIQCEQNGCDGRWAGNIPDLIQKCCDKAGVFRCDCGRMGYIKKVHKLQEGGTATFLWKGALLCDESPSAETTYFPYVVLMTSCGECEPIVECSCREVDCIQFCTSSTLQTRTGSVNSSLATGQADRRLLP